MNLTDYLAIYGASLSTFVAGWNAVRVLPKIRVQLVDATDDFGGILHNGIGISVQNPSSHAIHITSIAILYPYTNATVRDRVKYMIQYKRVPLRVGWVLSVLSNHGIADGCPTTIEPQKAHWVFVPNSALENISPSASVIRLRAVVQDALWREKYSKTLEHSLQFACAASN